MKALILFATAALGFAFTSSAQSFTRNPIVDAFVVATGTNQNGNNADSNYGGAGALAVSGTGTVTGKGEFDSLLRFDLTPAIGLTIQSITLQFVATNPANPLFNGSVAGQFTVKWMQSDAWVEGTGMPSSSGTAATTGITYNTLPNFVGASDETLGTFSFPVTNGGPTTSGTNSYTLQLTSGFLADVTAGNIVSLEILPADSSVSFLVNSGNFPTASSRPLLTVAAVPEPTSFMLGGAGLLALAGLYRFSSRKR